MKRHTEHFVFLNDELYVRDIHESEFTFFFSIKELSKQNEKLLKN